jgi:hypothetical protein
MRFRGIGTGEPLSATNTSRRGYEPSKAEKLVNRAEDLFLGGEADGPPPAPSKRSSQEKR